MNIIFLDVDGVLNRSISETPFENDKLLLLKFLVESTSSKIVLSSD